MPPLAKISLHQSTPKQPNGPKPLNTLLINPFKTQKQLYCPKWAVPLNPPLTPVIHISQPSRVPLFNHHTPPIPTNPKNKQLKTKQIPLKAQVKHLNHLFPNHYRPWTFLGGPHRRPFLHRYLSLINHQLLPSSCHGDAFSAWVVALHSCGQCSSNTQCACVELCDNPCFGLVFA